MMENKLRIWLKAGVIFAGLAMVFAFIPTALFAQGIPTSAPPMPPGPPQSPIGGIVVFAAVGGVYGIKQLWDKNKC